MEQTEFFNHYKISTSTADSPQEIGRSGAAIVHQGIDTRSSQPVALQLIPVASLDPVTREQFEQRASAAKQLDHINIARVLEVGIENNFLVLVSELVEGETTEAWVVANGPMPLAAVLHVALQVVRGLEAAAFFSLAHRALQPSNIMIVPGTGPDGGWPFVKLLNFGLASAESHSSDTPGAALAPSMSPQFASPEQLRGQPIDFASEVYSLGKTIYFLLTGAAPLNGAIPGHNRGLTRLPRVPRRLRSLLGAMLSEESALRPQDPVALEKELLECLTNVEKRDSIRRKLGIPTLAILPRWTMSSRPPAQILRGAIAFGLLMLVGAGVTAAFFPRAFHFNRSASEIGVPIGVSQPQSGMTPPPKPAPTTAPASAPVPTIVAENNLPRPAVTAPPTTSPQIAAASPAAVVQPPAEGPEENSPAEAETKTQSAEPNNSTRGEESSTRLARSHEDSNDSDATSDSESHPAKSKKSPSVASSERSRASSANEDEGASRRNAYPRHGSFRAVMIGRTPDGRPILRLPSGRVVIATRGEPLREYQAPRPRRVIRQPDFNDDDGHVPLQPFNQPQD